MVVDLKFKTIEEYRQWEQNCVDARCHLTDIFGIVEATSFEHMACYDEYHKHTVRPQWDEQSLGIAVQLASMDERPISISIIFSQIEGHRVIFWHPISQLVDHRIIDGFFSIVLPDVYTTNGMNFFNLIHKIRDANDKT